MNDLEPTTITVEAPPGTRVQMPVVQALLQKHSCPDCAPKNVTVAFDPVVCPDPDSQTGWTVTTLHGAGCPGLVLRLLGESE